MANDSVKDASAAVKKAGDALAAASGAKEPTKEMKDAQEAVKKAAD